MITEIKVGDYIEKSELDTEQKYNDVVEVFRGFGFEWVKNATTLRSELVHNAMFLTCCDDGLWHTTDKR